MKPAMKIIHTSDWHLGARLHERERTDDHKRFLAFLRSLVESERPDALVVAGDVFDVRQPSPAAQRLYYDFIADTARAGLCPAIVVIAGNHDSAQMLAAADQVLRRLGVRVVAKAGDGIADEVIALGNADGSCGLAIAAVPFMSDAELANFWRAAGESGEGLSPGRKIAQGFRAHYAAVIAEAKRQGRGAPVLALGHCNVSGARVSDARSERGRQTGGLDERDAAAFAGADCVALGHLHIPQKAGASGRVLYCGSPLPMSFAEAGQKKFVNVIEFGKRAGGEVTVREIEVPEFTPLRVLDGTPEKILADLDALVAQSERPVCVALKVTDGEGEISAFVNAARSVAQGSPVEILPIEDLRKRDAAPSQAVRRTATLESLAPRDVAMLRLADEHLDEAEMKTYAAMIDEIVAGL